MLDIQAYWRAVLDQDARRIRDYFADQALIRWHNTNEEFGVEEFIRANCEYPGSWDGTVERLERIGNLIITAVRVYTRDRTSSFHAVSFIQTAAERIISIDEYWGDDGPAPEWRRDMRLGKPIKREDEA